MRKGTEIAMNRKKNLDRLRRSLELEREHKPAYAHLYPFLEALYTIRERLKDRVELDVPLLDPALAATQWREGFPLLRREEFPLDVRVAEGVLEGMEEHVPADSESLKRTLAILRRWLATHESGRESFWRSFVDPGEPAPSGWEMPSEEDGPALMLWVRAAWGPSVEETARGILERFPLPPGWRRGYCPVCGCLPSLLFLQGRGERKGLCSWCGTRWTLNRIQCPFCSNRCQDSLGYACVEEEPRSRIDHCNLCRAYFKVLDVRELVEEPYFPLLEWTTLHLDLLAQRAGWKQPPSTSPVVYDGEGWNR